VKSRVEASRDWPAQRAAAGPAAALVVLLAAEIVAEVARASGAVWDGAAGVAAQAVALRLRARRLADEDLEAREMARRALELVGDRGDTAADGRLGDALSWAAEVPLRIAEAGADTASLAELAAERGADDLRPDAAGAAALAAGAARAAAKLVEVNLSTRADDQRVTRSQQLLAGAEAACARALAH
jgi:formiminotetrahydrofolate cyclodeaminase